MARDTADYEASEEIAISEGKKAFARSPWIFNRQASKRGFFAELRENNHVHPNYYSVHCVDGVGTKLFCGPWSGDYQSQMLDGIEMNANDMAPLIHAYPSSLDVYMACQTEVEEEHMGDIAEGIRKGIERIRIPDAPYDLNLGKLETASLDEMIALGVKGKGYDIGFVMSGFIEKLKVPDLNPVSGNVIVGVSSTGLHSNGYTGARHVIFTPDVEYREEWKSQYRGKWHFDDKPEILRGETVLEALSTPTASYLVEASLIGQRFDNRDIYGINITGNGLHNFNRAGSNVVFEITDPLSPLPIHNFLVQESGWDMKTAHRKQNMGMGFGYIAPDLETGEKIRGLINERGINYAEIVGRVRDARKSESKLKTVLYLGGRELEFEGYTN